MIIWTLFCSQGCANEWLCHAEYIANRRPIPRLEPLETRIEGTKKERPNIVTDIIHINHNK